MLDPMGVDCGVVFTLGVIMAGTWITVTASVFETAAVAALTWTTSPPPNTFAELLTETSESSGTVPVSVISPNSPPLPLIASFDVHVITLVLVTHIHPVPDPDHPV